MPDQPIQTQDPSQTPGAGTTEGYDWGSFQQQLPEEYQSDPGKFLEAYRSTADQAKQYQQYYDWYHKEYEPWQKTFDAKSYQDYLKSRQSPQGTQQQPQPTQSSVWDELTQELDWDDPAAAKVAYTRLMKALHDQRNTHDMHRKEVDQTKQQYLDLLHLLRQADEMRWQERDDFLKEKLQFAPMVNPYDVFQYAKEHGIADLTIARDQLYHDQHLAQVRAQAEAKARQEYEAKMTSQRPPTTEMTGGTPPRFRMRPTEAPRGEAATREAILKSIASKHPNISW